LEQKKTSEVIMLDRQKKRKPLLDKRKAPTGPVDWPKKSFLARRLANPPPPPPPNGWERNANLWKQKVASNLTEKKD